MYDALLTDEKAKLTKIKRVLLKKKKELVALNILVKQERLVQQKKIELEKENARLVQQKKIELEKEDARLAQQKKIELEKEDARLAQQKKLELEKKLLAQQKKRELKKVRLEQEKIAYERSKKIEKKIAILEELDSLGDTLREEELSLLHNNRKDKKKSKGKEKSFCKDLSKWFKSSYSYSSTLNNFTESNYGREAVKATFRLNPCSYFFANTTFVFDLNNYENIYYQPDFSYGFGYSDWHQGTWGFSYSNYANNKISPKNKERRFNFKDGTWEVNYKDKIDDISLSGQIKYLPSKKRTTLVAKVKTVVLDDIMISAQVKKNLNNGATQIHLSSKTVIFDKFFIGGSAYLYPEPSKQTSLEPDYAFTFGWKETRPFHPSISYSNYYSPTRWERDKGPKFKDGSISINFNIKF